MRRTEIGMKLGGGGREGLREVRGSGGGGRRRGGGEEDGDWDEMGRRGT